MATVANAAKKAALDAITALLNSGSFRVLTSVDGELAVPTFASTAFGAATTASPSVATAAALTADTSITAGTFTKFEMRTSAPAVIFSGSVGVGSGDIQVADNVIPATATSFTITGLTISLQL
jgi:hypothetical protein